MYRVRMTTQYSISLTFGRDFRSRSRANDNDSPSADKSLLHTILPLLDSRILQSGKWESTRTLIRSIISPYSTLNSNELVSKLKFALQLGKIESN